ARGVRRMRRGKRTHVGRGRPVRSRGLLVQPERCRERALGSVLVYSDGRFGTSQNCGDLGGRPVFEVVESDDLRLALGQRTHGNPEAGIRRLDWFNMVSFSHRIASQSPRLSAKTANTRPPKIERN